ncbi:MAG: ABC transporter permease, partial [Nanoarchaeota archaeon]
MGADRVMVVPKGLRGPPLGAEGLTKKDIDAVARVPDLERVSGILWLPANIEFNKRELYGTIQAVQKSTFDEDMKQMGREVAQGNSIQTAGKFAVVVGSKYTEKDDKRFDKEMRINNKIKINGYDFKVSGILKSTGVSEVDTLFWISLEDGREVFNKPEEVSAIAGYLRTGGDLEKAKERTIKELKKARDNEDFEVIIPSELKAQVNTILGVVQAVLIGIASISILVGA